MAHFQALPVATSGYGSDQKLAFSISGGLLGGILDQFGHLVADIGVFALSGN